MSWTLAWTSVLTPNTEVHDLGELLSSAEPELHLLRVELQLFDVVNWSRALRP